MKMENSFTATTTKASQAKYWFCTLNNPVLSLQELYELRQPHIKSMSGQLEVGKEDTPHLQFIVCFNKKKRLSFFKLWDKNIHAEIAKDIKAVHKYCNKEDTRVKGPWHFGDDFDFSRGGGDRKSMKYIN